MKMNKDVKLWQVGDEYMIVKREAGNYNMSDVYLLNETSAFLCESIKDKEFDNLYLKDMLCQEYHVDEETAIQDVNSFIEAMSAYGFFVK